MTQIILYALSSIGVLASSIIGPAMGQIYLFFHDVNPTLVKMIMTTPALFVIACAFMANPLVTRYGKKYALIIALLLYTLAGVGCGLVSNIYLVLFFRALLGVSLGILIPITQSLPIDLYPNSHIRNTIISRQTASNSAGNVIMVLLSGFVAAYSWRYTFFVYAIALPMAYLVYLYLPNTNSKLNNEDNIPLKLPIGVYTAAFSMFYFFAAVCAFYVNIAILIQERAIGDSNLASYVLAAGSCSSFIMAMNAQKVYKFIGDKLIALVSIITGLGFIMLNFAYYTPTFFIVAMLTSMGGGLVIPTCIIKIGNLVSKEQSVKALAIMNSCMFIGQFVSPILFDYLPRFSMADGIGGGALSLGFIMACSGVLLLGYEIFKIDR